MAGYQFTLVLLIVVFFWISNASAGINCSVGSGPAVHDVLNSRNCPGSSCYVFMFNKHITLHVDHKSNNTFGCADEATCKLGIMGWAQANHGDIEGSLYCCNYSNCNSPAEMKKQHMLKTSLDISSSLHCYEGNINHLRVILSCPSDACYNVTITQMSSDKEVHRQLFGCAEKNHNYCYDKEKNETIEGCIEKKNETSGVVSKLCCCSSDKCNFKSNTTMGLKPGHTSQNSTLWNLVSHNTWTVTAVVVLLVIGTVFTIFTVSCVIYNRRRNRNMAEDQQPSFSYQNLQADSVNTGYEQL